MWDLENRQEKVVQPLRGPAEWAEAHRGPRAGRDTLVAAIPSCLLLLEALSSAACIKSFSSSKSLGVYD